MLIYWTFWLCIVLFNFITLNYAYRKIFLGAFCLLLFVLVGWRWEIGADWLNYKWMFAGISNLTITSSLFATDPAYGLLNKLASLFGYDIVLVNVICAAIACYGLYFFAKNSQYPWLVLLLSFPYQILVVFMGYTRQGVAIGLVMLAFVYALKRKPYQYILFLLIACLFHKSAIVMLIIYPLVASNKFAMYSWRFYFYISLCFLGLIFLFSLLDDDNLYLTDQVFSAGVFPRFLPHVIPIMVYLVNRQKFNKMLLTTLPIFDLLFYLIALLFITAFFYSTIADRFNLYLIVFDIVILSCFVKMLNNRSQILFILCLSLIYSILIYVWLAYSPWARCCWQNYQNYLFL